jgi:hypothetical protein
MLGRRHSGYSPSDLRLAGSRAPQILLYLEVLKQLLDSSRYAAQGVDARFAQSATRYLLFRNIYFKLKRHILSFVSSTHLAVLQEDPDSWKLQPSDRKNQPTLPSVVAVSLLPFRTLDNSSTRISAASSFTRDFFSIPLLPNRLPTSALTALAKGLPFDDIITYIDSSGHANSMDLMDVIPLLANIVAFGKDRVVHFKTREVVLAYLNVLRALLDRLPPNIFADDKGKGRAVDEDGDVSMVDSDAEPPSGSPAVVDAESITLSALPSPSHTAALLAASTRFSASSRPAFAGLFVSLLQTWPSKRDAFVGALVYGRGSDQGGGLLREIWRGWLRSGKLGKALGGQREGSSRVLGALRGKQDRFWLIYRVLIEKIVFRSSLRHRVAHVHPPGRAVLADAPHPRRRRIPYAGIPQPSHSGRSRRLFRAPSECGFCALLARDSSRRQDGLCFRHTGDVRIPAESDDGGFATDPCPRVSPISILWAGSQ